MSMNCIRRLGSNASFSGWIQEHNGDQIDDCFEQPPAEYTTGEPAQACSEACVEGMWLRPDMMLLMTQLELMNNLHQFEEVYTRLYQPALTDMAPPEVTQGAADSCATLDVDVPDLIQLDSIDTGRGVALKPPNPQPEQGHLASIKTSMSNEASQEDEGEHVDSGLAGSCSAPEHSCSLIDAVLSDFSSINSGTPALSVESGCLESSIELSLSHEWSHDSLRWETPRAVDQEYSSKFCEQTFSGSFTPTGQKMSRSMSSADTMQLQDCGHVASAPEAMEAGIIDVSKLFTIPIRGNGTPAARKKGLADTAVASSNIQGLLGLVPLVQGNESFPDCSIQAHAMCETSGECQTPSEEWDEHGCLQKWESLMCGMERRASYKSVGSGSARFVLEIAA
eukprot:jgi/Ulvmu1/9342/UM050_0093.1